MKKNYLLIVTACILATSCTTLDVSKARKDYYTQQKQEEIAQTSDLRSSTIHLSTTPYSEPIQCLSKYLAKYQEGAVNKSHTGEYAFKQADMNSVIASENASLKEMKNRLDLLRFTFQKASFTNNFLLEKENIRDDEIDILASNAVLVKNLTEDIEDLKAEITQKEELISKYKRNLINPEGLSSYDYQDFVQGQTWASYSVSPIYDKTGKVFSSDSTALSEMVAHALTYNHAVRYKDTPFNGDWTFSRASLQAALTQSIGSALPADRYISGALVQYDEGVPFGSLSDAESVSLSIDPLQFDKGTTVINVGLILRTANADGDLIFNGFNNVIADANPEDASQANLIFDDFVDYSPASVYVQNTFFVKRIGFDLFEIKSDRSYGGSYSSSTSDPKTYAVREMVEKAVFELLLKSLPNQEKDQNNELIEWNLRNQAVANCLPKFKESEDNAL